MAAGFVALIFSAGQDDGKVVVAVAIGVADAASVNDGTVVQQGAVTFLNAAHFPKEFGEILNVEEINLFDLSNLLSVVLVVRQTVVALADANGLEAAVAAVVSLQEGADSCGVGLESQDQHVEHQAEVFFVISGNSSRLFEIGEFLGKLFGPLDTLFDFPNTGEVLIQFLAVRVAEFGGKGFCVSQNKVEKAFVVFFGDGLAFGGVGIIGAEDAFECKFRVVFGRHGHSFGLPRKIELVGTAVAGVTTACTSWAIAAEFQRWQTGQASQFLCRHLIYGDAELDVGTSGFPGLGCGEESGVGSCMVTATVTIGVGFLVSQAGNDLEVVFHQLQRLKCFGKFVIFTLPFRCPSRHDGPIGRVNESNPLRWIFCSGLELTGRHRFQPG